MDARSQGEPTARLAAMLGFGACVTHLLVYVLSVPTGGTGLDAGGRFALGFLLLASTPVTWGLSCWSGLIAASNVRGRPRRAGAGVTVAALAATATGWIIASVWWPIWADQAVWLDPASAAASANVEWPIVGWHAAWVGGPFVLVFVGGIVTRAVMARIRERRQSHG